MAITVSLLGVNYSVPEPGETGYGQALANYLKALATAFPQLSGGVNALTAELDFGASFGLKALYLKSETATPASAGQVRLAKTDLVKWRNNANGADLAMGIDAADALLFGGQNVTGLPMLGANTAAAQSINNSTTTVVVFGTTERDSDAAYNAGTGRYTVPAGKGGDYEISAAVTFANALGTLGNIAIFKNAALLKQVQYVSPGAGAAQTIAATVNLAAGDIIDIRITHNQGGAQALTAVAAQNFFALKRIPT